MKNPFHHVSPIFIVGSVRSGTSLLRLILTSHPDLCIAPESLFWLKLRPIYSKVPDLSRQIDSFINDLFQEEKFRAQWKLNPETVRSRLNALSPLGFSEAIAAVYGTYLESAFPKATIWGDKNPSYLKHIDAIREDFPTARFIHIIRDIRSIYASLTSIYRNESSRLHWKRMLAPLPYATAQWHYVYDVFQKKRKCPFVYTLFYEELVSNPEPSLDSLCSWLKIPFHHSMLQFYELNKKKQLVATFAHNWEQKTFQPLDQDRADSWRSELTPVQIQAVEIVNEARMTKMGYQPVSRGIRLRGWMLILVEYFPLMKKQWKRNPLRHLSISFWKRKLARIFHIR